MRVTTLFAKHKSRITILNELKLFLYLVDCKKSSCVSYKIIHPIIFLSVIYYYLMCNKIKFISTIFDLSNLLNI